MRPRAYVDWTVPTDSEGRDIGVCEDAASAAAYLEWLADYLYATPIPVPKSQQALLANYQKQGVNHAVIDLSDVLGYSILSTDVIEEQSASGIPFAEVHAEERQVWNEHSEEDKAGCSEEEFFTSESDYLRLGREFLEAQKVPGHIQHADIPYRPILAALFKDVPELNERFRLLSLFYNNFDECASR